MEKIHKDQKKRSTSKRPLTKSKASKSFKIKLRSMKPSELETTDNSHSHKNGQISPEKNNNILKQNHNLNNSGIMQVKTNSRKLQPGKSTDGKDKAKNDDLQEVRYKKRKVIKAADNNSSLCQDTTIEVHVELSNDESQNSKVEDTKPNKSSKTNKALKKSLLSDSKNSANDLEQVKENLEDKILEPKATVASDGLNEKNLNVQVPVKEQKNGIREHESLDPVSIVQESLTQSLKETETKKRGKRKIKNQTNEIVVRPGHYAQGDQPMRISMIEYTEDVSNMVFKIEWKQVDELSTLTPSNLTREELIQYDPLLLVYFYEKHLEFPKDSIDFDYGDLTRVLN